MRAAVAGPVVEHWAMSASSGTMRSVPSLPTGTRSQVPWSPKSTMQSSSRSSSSPTRIPVARSSRCRYARVVIEVATAAITARSTSGVSARGIASGMRGRSARKISRRGGAVGQPQSAMSSKNSAGRPDRGEHDHPMVLPRRWCRARAGCEPKRGRARCDGCGRADRDGSRRDGVRRVVEEHPQRLDSPGNCMGRSVVVIVGRSGRPRGGSAAGGHRRRAPWPAPPARDHEAGSSGAQLVAGLPQTEQPGPGVVTAGGQPGR